MPLPIEPAIPELRAALARHYRAVLEAPPGAGKTTRVPLALLDEPWLGGQRIVILEPRRLAARAAALRMATTLGEAIGGTVGYRIRRDTRVGRSTRIEVVTEGILTRMLQHDLALDGVGLVIFDEFHERSLVADTGLALTLASAESLRDDLRILVMSATLDGRVVADLLGGAPVVRSAGSSYPVVTGLAPPRPGSRIEAHVASVVREALTAEAGSLLVFLPGAGEITRVAERLAGNVPADTIVRPLHGSLPADAQDAAIAPATAGKRKVVLATSIAETSLTIDGIRVVIDSGEMRIPRFSPRTGMTRLETVRVSRASADQRRGRAGRLEPGICIRCWSAADDAGLVPFTRPEILDADLASLALDLAAAGFTDPGELRWLDPPPHAAFAQAQELLRLLGALDAAGHITPHGEAMTALGAHPRLAHMLVRAREAGGDSLATATTLVALLEERDILRSTDGPPLADVTTRLDAINRDVDAMQLAGAEVDRGAAARVREGVREWRRRVGPGIEAIPSDDELDAGLLLALAYPDRVAQRRDAVGRFLLRNGRGAVLPSRDPLAHAEWIVAAAIDDTGRDGRITLAAPLDVTQLVARAAEQTTSVDEIEWNAATGSVVARSRLLLGALALRDVAIADPDPVRVAAAFRGGIIGAGIDALPWGSAATLRARLAFLHHHDESWPDVSAAALEPRLEEWLGPDMVRLRKLDQLARVDMGEALRRLLTWEQRRELDELAPERIVVPSGSSVAIDYGKPAAPTLAVRLQEVFGMRATPRIMAGQVPLTMELLSPARRPVQVTRDLASFWANGYFDVRKDLRGRYPKHHWPDDPLAAEPVRGAKRRKR
ncbi:MAG TPA: ATP-dependent helicase HrpB [Gemmatimonadales bacterium]|jgi:ATP-dependent helicase HrpB